MKTAAVTELWEFYRDNCDGFKEPLHKRMREFDDLLADLESENAKLRELVRDMWRDGMCECDERFSGCPPCEYHYNDCMRELGIEVDG